MNLFALSFPNYDRQRSLALVKQQVLKKEKSEFEPDVLR